MKEKRLNNEEFKDLLEQGGKLVFTTTSPFSEFTMPQTGIFIAYHFRNPEIHTATGTAYVCRVGTPLDFDVYSIRRSISKNGKEVLFVDVPKDKIGYHHAADLPDVLRDGIPQEIKDKVEKIKGFFEES